MSLLILLRVGILNVGCTLHKRWGLLQHATKFFPGQIWTADTPGVPRMRGRQMILSYRIIKIFPTILRLNHAK